MATNRELKAEIETLSAQLGVSIETDRLNNSALSKRLDELRQQLAAREVHLAAPPAEPAPPDLAEPEPGPLFGATKRTAPSTPEAPPAVLEPPAAEPSPPAPDGDESAPSPPPPAADDQRELGPFRYRVGQGRLIHGVAGKKIGAFKPISARDLPGGQTDLDELERAGHVEKVRRGKSDKPL